MQSSRRWCLYLAASDAHMVDDQTHGGGISQHHSPISQDCQRVCPCVSAAAGRARALSIKGAAAFPGTLLWGAHPYFHCSRQR